MSSMRALATVAMVIVALLAAIPDCLAGYDVWSTRGLVGRNNLALAIDPHGSHRLYLCKEGQGPLFSGDGGSQWTHLATPFRTCTQIAVDFHEPSIFYAIGDNQLFKSADGGSTWVPMGGGVLSRPQSLVLDPQTEGVLYVGTQGAASRSVDGGVSWSGLGVPASSQVTAVAVDPRDSNTIYAYASGEGLFKSTDGGQSWAVIESELGRARVQTLAIDAENSQVLYASGNSETYRSTDGGDSWTLFLLSDGNPVLSVTTDPHHAGRVYGLGRRGGLFRSDDGGGSWSSVGQGLQENWYGRLVFDPQVADIAYAVDGQQVHKSFDGGRNWVPPQAAVGLTFLQRNPTKPEQLFAGSAEGALLVSGDLGITWRESVEGLPEGVYVTSVGFDPGDADVMYTGTRQGLYRSADSAGTWANTGLPTNIQVATVAVSPEDSKRMLVGGQGGLWLSTNGGQSWAAPELPNSARVSVLAFDPESPALAYAGTNIGLLQSTDGGMSWEQTGQQLGSVSAIALKPGSSSTAYVATQQGAFRREGSDGSWSVLSAGLPDYTQVTDLLLDPQDPEVVFAASNSGVFVSPNAGKEWYAVSDGLGDWRPIQLEVAATDPTVLLGLAHPGRDSSLWEYTLGTIPTPTVTPTTPPTMTPYPSPTRPPTSTPVPVNSPLPHATPSPRGTTTDQPSPKPTAPPLATEPFATPDQAPGDEGDAGGFPWLLVIAAGAGLLAIGLVAVVLVRRSGQGSAVTKCPECGSANAPEYKFCLNCGHRLR